MFNEKPIYSFKKISKHDWLIEDDNENFSHKKNYQTKHVSRCFNVNYEFNNVGARDNIDYHINDPEKSIILIGDSFAEGYGVKTNKIFSKLIEKKIGKKVLNFGVAGFDPQQQIFDYINHGSKFNHDELIYFFLPHNDYLSKKNDENNEIIDKKNNYSFSLNIEKLKLSFYFFKLKSADLLARFTYSYNFFRSAKHLLDFNTRNKYENLSYFIQNKETSDYTFEIVENLINYKNVKSYIVIIPSIYDINNVQRSNDNYKNLYWYKKINQLAKRNNSTLIDLMDFVNFDKKFSYFLTCDGHWSEYGNIFAASSFLTKYFKN